MKIPGDNGRGKGHNTETDDGATSQIVKAMYTLSQGPSSPGGTDSPDRRCRRCRDAARLAAAEARRRCRKGWSSPSQGRATAFTKAGRSHLPATEIEGKRVLKRVLKRWLLQRVPHSCCGGLPLPWLQRQVRACCAAPRPLSQLAHTRCVRQPEGCSCQERKGWPGSASAFQASGTTPRAQHSCNSPHSHSTARAPSRCACAGPKVNSGTSAAGPGECGGPRWMRPSAAYYSVRCPASGATCAACRACSACCSCCARCRRRTRARARSMASRAARQTTVQMPA